MTNTLPVAMALPSAAGSLETYIQAVARFPLLTEEEEVRLARQLRDTQDVDAAKQLVLSHLRLVVSIARGYLGYGLPHSDLIQEGNIGLMKAVKRFDPDRGVRLVSFAVHWIRAEIHEHILRNWRIVKIATTKAQRKLFFNLRSMKKGHGALTRDETEAMANTLRVKTPDLFEPIRNLSGGNQQKVLVGRWLMTSPRILILDEPTRGIDVGAKADIHRLISNLATDGAAIVMISSEMPEILGMSDRVMVMREGRTTGILDRREANQVDLMRLAAH